MTEIKALTVLWEVSAAIGVFVQAWLIWDSRASLLALRRRGKNGAARLVAWHDIRTDAIGLVIMVIQVFIGVTIHLVIFRGDPPFSRYETWAIAHSSQVLRYGLITSIDLAVASGIWKRYDRHRLLETVTGEAVK